MYMVVFSHICLHIFVSAYHINLCVGIHVCECVCKGVCVSTYMCVCICQCIFMYVYGSLITYVFVCSRMFVNVHTCS